MKNIIIGERAVGQGHPTYIIAEVGANFDGDLVRAKELAKLAKDLGADAYKIQNFEASKIVSSEGFKNLQVSFQAQWDKSVVEVYRKAEFPREWLKELSDYCKSIDIDFFSAPYDVEVVDLLEDIGVPMHKIGSGEIDNHEFLVYVAKTGKPIMVACGAATEEEVVCAIETIRGEGNDQIVLLQCVTNYPSPVSDANICAMKELGKKYDVLVGYSDHTTDKKGGGDDPLWGITVPLASVALGGCVIEKHFTDDRTRKGPDHPHAMEPDKFDLMVKSVRALEKALGDGKKRVMPSEKETVVIQRRGAYATEEISKGETISRNMFEFLRPAAGIRPGEVDRLLGKKAKHSISAGKPIKFNDIKD